MLLANRTNYKNKRRRAECTYSLFALLRVLCAVCPLPPAAARGMDPKNNRDKNSSKRNGSKRRTENRGQDDTARG